MNDQLRYWLLCIKRARGWATKKGQGDTKQNKNKAPRELRLCLVYRKLAGFQRHCTKGDRQHNTKLKPSSTVCVCLFVLYAKSLLKNKGKKKWKMTFFCFFLMFLLFFLGLFRFWSHHFLQVDPTSSPSAPSLIRYHNRYFSLWLFLYSIAFSLSLSLSLSTFLCGDVSFVLYVC